MISWGSVRGKSMPLMIFSTLVVPAALLMAQAPTLTLPTTPVTGVQTATTGPTYSTMALSGIGSGYSITNTTYNAWCTNPNSDIPSDILNLATNPPSLFDPTGAAQYQPYSSYASNLPTDGNAGTAGNILNSQTVLTVAQEWQIVNYAINFPNGLHGTIPTTMTDVQAAIWQILRPQDGIDYLTDGDQYAAQLYADAIENGIGFTPKPGQLIAVVLDPITPANSPVPYQGVFIQVPVPKGSICLKKCANVSTAKCFQSVTYYYTVTNTGNTTLTNIAVKDDNGTPNNPNDDFVVGTIASLSAGASQTLTHKTYLPITEYAVDSKGNSNWSTLITTALPNGNIQVTLLQDEDLIDNTYGSTTSGGWLGQHNNFANHLGSDSAEFQFTDGDGNVVLDFNADYVSQSKQYPSGYGTAGVKGGAGQVYFGNPSNIVSVDTTLTDTLNQSSKYYGNTTNSPSPVDHTWNSVNGYTVVINGAAFGRNGFGQCNIKTVQNSQCKTGGGHYKPTPTCSVVTNTATVTAQVESIETITATATASVQVRTACQQTCQQQQHKCQRRQQQCQCQCWECQHGNHNQCQNQQCHDPNCPHQQVQCQCPQQQQCQCQCSECRQGHHNLCQNHQCHDPNCPHHS